MKSRSPGLTQAACLATLVLTLSPSIRADDWSGWRGPNGWGVSAESNLPAEWSATQNVRWSLDLPGKGVSSPVIVGARVYLTAQSQDDTLHVLAIDRDRGAIIWNKPVGKGRLKAHEFHNMATSTAVADADRVWAFFGTGDLICLDASGEIVWRRNLQESHGKFDILWGLGTSPVRFQDSLFIAIQHQGPSYVLAVNAKTGEDLWKAERKLDAKDEALDSYSSPLIVPTDSGAEVIVSGADHINAYDAATGRQRWISGGLAVSHPYGRTIAGPAAGEGYIVTVASGFQNRGRVLALKCGGSGDVTESHRAWVCERYSPDCPSPVVYRGKAYFIRDDGIGSCVDLATGEPDWQERIFTTNVKVSPVAGDGKIYFSSGQGECVVVRAGSTLDIVARNDLGEAMLGTPSISDGKLFIRTASKLLAVGP